MRKASKSSGIGGDPSASIEHTLSLIDGKFKCIIMSYLAEKSYRFNELHIRIGTISERTLAIQLRSLEQDGLVARQEYDSSLKRVKYHLTVSGRQLTPVMALMRDWALTNIQVRQDPKE